MRYATEMVERGGVICNQLPIANQSLRRGGPPGAHLDLDPTQTNFTSDRQTLQGNSGIVHSTMAAIVRENQELRRCLQCELCKATHRCVVFMPCGHLITCVECASHIEQRCPICRSDISYMIKVRS
ncbi:hypothetical protein ACJMK2_028449 [Sinanodonta woodiana]|uniref:RING-type domain-containing protein n=1 Tax=Sinanodonta woodiana TaxID=1069815 RepID=A0ABD3X8W5_SINWO